MPTYDYECASCGHKEEIIQKITENALSECPQCRAQTFTRKIGAGLGLQFQGSGFYITDYGSCESASSDKNKKASPPSSSGCGCGKSTCPN